MSTISIVLGCTLFGFTSSASLVKRSSGTVITPIFGSMVQNGKFAACAFAFDKQLNKVDLPTFGRPTMPHCNAIRYVVLRFEYKNAKILIFKAFEIYLLCYKFLLSLSF
jgi:hypothetical protein